ncbi:PspC domain-containing protein [Streptomyces sp. NPDC097619]|uniref:PspC domain-containing protein n=1 Tax=Streptomyces sp. NPDC097619 TaxID=3157228 RepID=UPI003334268F
MTERDPSAATAAPGQATGQETGREAAPSAEPPPLRRSRRGHALAGVCGGLGRRFDVDPVIFRIVLGVLAVTGGVGLLFYGFAWLLVPLEGEEENEAKRLLTGRIEGSTLAAVLTSLVGCALFLSMLDNGAMAAFSVLVMVGLGAAARWSRRRRAAAETADEPAHPRPEAPPETKAPPTPVVMSWWKDPLLKDAEGRPVSVGYLWGPDSSVPAGHRGFGEPDPDGALAGRTWPEGPEEAGKAAVRPRGGGIGGRIFLLAVLAAVAGTAASWHGHPLGQALQTGFAAALAVFGLGLAVSSVRGRTGFGTLLLSVLTAGLLLGATVMPREIGTDWMRTTWRPTAVSAVQPSYTAGTGLATLDLSRLDLPKGRSLAVSAEIRAGRLKVVLPREVTARAEITLGVGDVQLPGERQDHVRVQRDRTRTAVLPPEPGTEPGGTIELRLEAAVGQVEVARAAS